MPKMVIEIDGVRYAWDVALADQPEPPPVPEPDPEPEPDPSPFDMPDPRECLFFYDFAWAPLGRIKDDTGPLFDNNGGPWAQYYTRGSSAESATVEEFHGVRCLRFNSQPSSTFPKNQLKSWLPKRNSGAIRAGGYFYFPADYKVPGNNGPRLFDIGNGELRFSLQGSGGTISVNNKNTGNEERDGNAKKVPVGRWVRLEMEFDIGQGAVQCFIDGEVGFSWSGRTCKDMDHWQIGLTAADNRNLPLDLRLKACWVKEAF